jgi:large subunit ribosomal protein L29
MAIVRSREIREMGVEEIDNRMLELNSNLMKIKGIMASGGIPEEIGKVREIRRTIARISTVKKESESATKSPIGPKNLQGKFLGKELNKKK